MRTPVKGPSLPAVIAMKWTLSRALQLRYDFLACSPPTSKAARPPDGSLRRETNPRDQLAVELNILDDRLAELLWRRCDGNVPLFGERALHLRILECLDHLSADARHVLGRRPRRNPHAIPDHVLVALEPRFVDGGHFGKRAPAHRRGDAEGPQLARLDMREHDRPRADGQIDAPAEKIDHGLRDPLVGHVRDLRPGRQVERLDRQLYHAAHAAGAVVELAGLRLRERHQLLHRPRGYARVNDQHETPAVRHERDGSEVLHRSAGEAIVDARQTRVSGGGEKDRVTVRL